jgi:tRNA1(Val) A37 N6-methylase TrmN6
MLDAMDAPAQPPPALPPLTPPRRPEGWVPPGPEPACHPIPLDPGIEELSLLTGDWRILQRRDGHRWSLDDLVTAWCARRAALTRSPGAEDPGPFLDLGTGIGSVALMLAWSFPSARVTGVEAQALSFAMATRSARYNGCEDRVTFVHADLREAPGREVPTAAFPIVTGTPPYFGDPLQTRSSAPQKGPCRFEERGGVDGYLAAFDATLAPDGRAILCHAARQRPRVLSAIAASGFAVVHHLEVVPKVGRDPLVDVFTLARTGMRPPAAPSEPSRLTVRDADDQWTPDFLALRADMGLPPPRHQPPQAPCQPPRAL